MLHILRNLGPDHLVIEVVLQGSLQDPDVRDALASAVAMLYETGIGDALIDASSVSFGMSIPEVIDMADTLASMGVPSSWRQAIVKPNLLDAAVSINLWAVALTNRGMIVEVFPTRDEALDWLITGKGRPQHLATSVDGLDVE